MQLALFPQPGPSSMAKVDAAEMKLHSKVRMFTEMVETLMAFLRLFIVLEQHGTNRWNDVKTLVESLLSKCRTSTPEFSKFSVESEMMKIAVHGDHSALSTLYFFQVRLLKVLLHVIIVIALWLYNRQNNRTYAVIRISVLFLCLFLLSSFRRTYFQTSASSDFSSNVVHRWTVAISRATRRCITPSTVRVRTAKSFNC